MATLTVTIQEDLILNGNDRSNTNTATFACNELDHRIVTITNAEKSILLFDSANEAGTIKDTKLEYLRITNLDGSATVNLRVRDDAQEFMIQLKAGGSNPKTNRIYLHMYGYLTCGTITCCRTALYKTLKVYS